MTEQMKKSSDGFIAEDFGQRVDLTQRIKEVLQNYPDVVSLLKEMVQNADDAKASTIKICLDYRSHPQTDLAFAKLSGFQGPCLLVYNDAIFTEEDFASIQNVGNSRKVDKPHKTGRFGIGFNSVYHVTDVPSFVSGRRLVFFDPHCLYLPQISSSNPGKMIDFSKYDVMKQNPNQFSPYAAFGCDMKSKFDGTLFRLPLRTTEQAKKSRICHSAFPADTVLKHLREFQTIVSETLLFLKYVSDVSVLVWAEGQRAPDTLFRANIENAAKFRNERRFLEQLLSTKSLAPRVSKHMTLRIALTSQDNPEPHVQHWRICQTTGAGPALEMTTSEEVKEYGLTLVPWGGVATCEVLRASNSDAVNKGRGYCFLPLPTKTGVPVHINGYFELSSNRRDIWHGDDMALAGRVRSDWNEALLADVCTYAYVSLLLDQLSELLQASSAVSDSVLRSYYATWPRHPPPPLPWKILVTSLCKRMVELPCLLTRRAILSKSSGRNGSSSATSKQSSGFMGWFSGGSSKAPSLPANDPQAIQVSSTPSVVLGEDVARFFQAPFEAIAPKDAVFLPEIIAKEYPWMEPYLVANGVPVVAPPQYIQDLLVEEGNIKPATVSPQFLRGCLRSNNVLPPDPKTCFGLSLRVLLFCTSDLVDISDQARLLGRRQKRGRAPGGGSDAHEGNVFADLVGLPLLPLANCTVAPFLGCGGTAEAVFVCNDEESYLCAPLSSRVVWPGHDARQAIGNETNTTKPVATDSILHWLEINTQLTLAVSELFGRDEILESTNVARMSPVMMASLIPSILQASCEKGGLREVPGGVVWQKDKDLPCSSDWLSRFWIYFTKGCSDYSHVEGLPLLPCCRQDEPTDLSTILARVRSQSSWVIDAHPLPQDVISFLQTAGCLLLDSDCSISVPRAMFDYGIIHPGDPSGVLEALAALRGSGGLRRRRVEDLPTKTRQSVFAYFAEYYSKAGAVPFSKAAVEALRGLPLFSGVPRPTSSSTGGSSVAGGRYDITANATGEANQSKKSTDTYTNTDSGSSQPEMDFDAPLDFISLDTEPVFLCSGIPYEVLFSVSYLGRFGWAASDGARRLMEQCGAVSISLGVFALDFFLVLLCEGTSRPINRDGAQNSTGNAGAGTNEGRRLAVHCLQALSTSARDEMLLHLLRSLPAIESARTDAIDVMKQRLLIPTQGGKLRSPMLLFDPKVVEAGPLLGADDCFPATPFTRPSVLSALVAFGLQLAISRNSILQAAQEIATEANVEFARREHEASHSDIQVGNMGLTNNPPSLHHTATACSLSGGFHSRAKALLSYLDSHAVDMQALLRHEIQERRGYLMNVISSAWGGGAKADKEAQSAWDDFLSRLFAIPWVPVQQERLDPVMPWKGARRGVVQRACALASDFRPCDDAWLVSASMWLLDGDVRSEELRRFLGWTKPPPVEAVVEQLIALGEAVPRWSSKQPSQQSSSDSASRPVQGRGGPEGANVRGSEASGDAIDSRDDAVKQLLAVVIPKVYARLEEAAHTRSSAFDTLKEQACIWTGEYFVRPKAIAFQCPSHSAPYLHSVPADLVCFSSFLRLVGVRDEFSVVDYARALETMRSDLDGSAIRDPRALGFAINLVQSIAGEKVKMEIIVPDEHGLLLEASCLVFDDAPWLSPEERVVDTSASSSAVRLVHPKISNSVAEKVGVRSLRGLLVAGASAPIGLPLDEAEAYGQHESLTSRIKGIVEVYADGPGIIHELIQNADDAHASEVCIMLDKTTYGSSSLLSPQLTSWQGPALYVYNDSSFSAADFHNLCRIGQQNKKDELLTTGRFGLGFNAVYHFTDVPSFVSGDYVVFLDPHARYLPGVSHATPGIKIKFTGNQTLQRFPDQIAPFRRFGCDMKHRFKGTLFRFPLRNQAMANLSEIKNEECSPDGVEKLLRSLQDGLPRFLLFLKHVRRVKILIRLPPTEAHDDNSIVDPSADAQLLFHGRIRAQHTEDNAAWDIVPDFVGGTLDQPISKQQFYAKLKLAASIGKSGTPLLPRSVVHAVTETTAAVEGGGTRSTRTEWLLSATLGCRSSLRLSLDPENHILSFVPWGAVAVPLGSPSKGDSVLDAPGATFKGQAFCFLPLPVATGLPVHVNGYFELSANRRDIWHGGDMQGLARTRSDWNQALLVDPIAEAYARALMRAKDILPESEFYKLWPQRVPAAPWNLLVTAVYRIILQWDIMRRYTPVTSSLRGAARFRAEPKFVSPDSAVFVRETDVSSWVTSFAVEAPASDDDNLSGGQIAQETVSLVDILASGLLRVVCIPDAVLQLLEDETGVPPCVLSPALLRDLLRDPSFGGVRIHVNRESDDDDSSTSGVLKSRGSSQRAICDLLRANRKAALLVLEYVMSDLNATMLEELWGIPLLPTQDLTFQTFSPPRSLESPDGQSGDSSLDAHASVHPVVYMCSQQESKLLNKVPQRVLADDVPRVVAALLRSDMAEGQLNLRRLRIGDVTDMLPELLGEQYREQMEVEWDKERNSPCSVEWLRQLWDAVKVSNCPLHSLSLWPLLPTAEGKLYRVFPDSCVIDMKNVLSRNTPSTGELSDSCTRFLVSQGCLSLDRDFADVLPAELVRMGVVMGVEPSSVLRALTSAVLNRRRPEATTRSNDHVGPESAEEVDEEATVAFLSYCCEGMQNLVSAGLGEITKSVIWRLRCVPVWNPIEETASSDSVGPRDFSFVSLEGGSVRLAPLSVPERLLRDPEVLGECRFVRSVCDKLPELLSFLGVMSLSSARFALSHALPALTFHASENTTHSGQSVSEADITRRLSLAVVVLEGLAGSDATEEKMPLLDSTRLERWVPSEHGSLHAPEDLLFREAIENEELTDESLIFVHPSLVRAHRTQLAEVGVGEELSMRYLKKIATDIQRVNVATVALSSSTAANPVAPNAKGMAFLRFLDKNFVRLCPSGVLDEALLQSAWVPVATEPPVEDMLWNNEWRVVPLASPQDTRPLSDAPLVSASMRLVDYDVTSPQLVAALGWDRPPQGVAVARQLIVLLAEARASNQSLQVLRRNSADDEGGDPSPAQSPEQERQAMIVQHDEEVVHPTVMKLYRALRVAYEARMFDGVSDVLKDESVIRVAPAVYVPPSWVARTPNFAAPPLLYVLPDGLHPLLSMLLAAGVRDSFGAFDLVSALARIRSGQRRSREPLVESELETVATLLRDLTKCAEGDATGSSIYLPDVAGWMGLAEDLLYNDAPWIDTSTECIPGRLVHPKVPNEVAAALGVASLRKRLSSGQEASNVVRCPQVQQIRSKLASIGITVEVPAGIETKLFLGLLELSDLLRCSSVHIMLDLRAHRAESLLRPAYADTVGPALCICLRGVTLTTDMVSHLLQLERHEAIHQGRQHLCCGLLSCFAIADSLQLVSGKSWSVFDPTGRYLGDERDNDGYADTDGLSPVARGFEMNENLITRFADHFKPFEDTGFGFTAGESFEGTILRLPLRFGPPPPGPNSSHTSVLPIALDLDEMRESFVKFGLQSRNCLLFMNSLREVEVLMWDRTAHSAVSLVNTTVSGSEIPTNERGSLFYSSSWKKRGSLVGWLGLASHAAKQKYTITLSTVLGVEIARRLGKTKKRSTVCEGVEVGDEALTEEISRPVVYQQKWLISHALAYGKSRDLALESYRLGDAPCPIATVATPIPLSVADNFETLEGVPVISSLDSFLYAHVPIPTSLATSNIAMPVSDGPAPMQLADGVNAVYDDAPDPADNFEDPARDAGPHASSNVSQPYPPPAAVLVNGGFTVNPDSLCIEYHDRWNRELLTCVNEAYLELVGALPATTVVYKQVPRRVYEVLPRETTIPHVEIKSILMPAFYSRLKEQPIFQVKQPVRGSFSTTTSSTITGVRLGDGQVLAAAEATIKVFNFLSYHFTLLDIPSEVVEAFQVSCASPQIQELSPSAVRSYLRSKLTRDVDLKKPKWRLLSDPEHSSHLLRFLLCDVIHDNPEGSDARSDSRPQNAEDSAVRSACQYLLGVKLLPLADGTLVRLGEKEYIVASDSQRALISGSEREFVHPLCANLRCLQHDVVQSVLRLRKFGPDALLSLMHGHFTESGEPTTEWLHQFWDHLSGSSVDGFGSYSLLPLTSGKVVKVETLPSTVVLPLMQFDIHLARVLERLGCQVLAYPFAYYFSDFATTTSADVRRQVLKALQTANDRRMLDFDRLSRVDSLVLLTFVATSGALEDMSEEEMEIMKNLPILEASTSEGKKDPDFLALSWRDHIYVAPSDPFFLAASLGNRFLRNYHQQAMRADVQQDISASKEEIDYTLEHTLTICTLLSRLGVSFLEEASMFERFLLDPEHYDTLRCGRKLRYIKRIKDRWVTLSEYPGLRVRLQEVPCVPIAGEVHTEQVAGSSSSTQEDAEGHTLVRASTVFDPHHRTFAAVCGDIPNKFPHRDYLSSSWLSFFRDIGMRTEMTSDAFLECARAVSSQAVEGEVVSSAILSKAITLLDFLRANLQQLYSVAFCDALADIPIVPAKQPSVELVPPAAADPQGDQSSVWTRLRMSFSLGSNPTSDDRVFVKYSDCALPKDFSLCWSIVHVVPEAYVLPYYTWQPLRVQTPVPMKCVIRHVERLAVAVDKRERMHAPLVAVFSQILAYIRDKWGDLNSAEKRRFGELPLVPVGDVLYRASRVLEGPSSTDAYAPLLRRLPPELSDYSELLETLGMVKGVGATRLTRLTAELVAEFSGRPLNVCELSAMVNVLQAIAEDRARTGSSPSHNANQQSDCGDDGAGRVFLRGDNEVYVPSEDSVLIRARECHYDDMPWLASRINRRRITFVHVAVPADVSYRLGIAPLTSVLRETLEPGFEPKVVANGTIGGLNDSTVTALLSSANFAKGVVRVVEREGPDTAWAKSVKVEKVRERLMGLRTCFVDVLRTRFSLRSGRIAAESTTGENIASAGGGLDVTLDPEGTPAFVDEREKCLFVARQPLEASGLRVEDALARALCTLLGFPQLLPLSPLISASSPDMIPRIMMCMQWNNDDSLAPAASRGLAGSQVVDPDVSLLSPDEFHHYYPGEVVAWGAGQWDSAHQLLKSIRASHDSLEATPPSVYYGVVRTCQRDIVSCVSKVRVVTAPSGAMKDFLGTQLLVFRSHRGFDTHVIPPADSHFEDISNTLDMSPENAGHGGSRTCDSCVHVASSTQAHGRDGGERGVEVSEVDVVDALQGLLTALDAPLDLEKKKLMQELVKLRREVKAHKSEAKSFKARAEKAESAVEDLESASKCSICLTRTADTVIIPCGHLLCGECFHSLQRQKCPYCRQDITMSNKFIAN
eukprot:Rmarinus@m.28251